MKKLLPLFAILGIMVACSPENNPGVIQNNPNELTVTGEALDVAAYSAILTGYANLPLEMGDAEIGIMYDTKQSFEDGRKIVATVLDGNNKFSVRAKGLASGTTYYYKAYVQNGKSLKYGAVLSFATKEAKEPTGAVYLGTEMTRKDGTTYNLYWAKSNLSEDGLCPNPEDYGDYYAWGEAVPHYVKGHSQDSPCKDWRTIEGKALTGYNWVSYKWIKGDYNGNYNQFTRYYPTDKKTEFSDYNYADDAARATLGGKWRMPTDEEWKALLANCTWTRTAQNGVYGMLVSSKTNGNSIFLPAAGWRDVAKLDSKGYGSAYWSSSLCTDEQSQACCVGINNDNLYRRNLYRYYGFSIRPVSE